MTDLYNKPELMPTRRTLRRKMPPCEYILWARLRNRQIAGLKFRRQYAIDNYVVDFYCAEAMLAVEIDGFSHTFEETWTKDEIRQTHIEAIGIQMVRFLNQQVIDDADSVIEQIAEAIANRMRTRD